MTFERRLGCVRLPAVAFFLSFLLPAASAEPTTAELRQLQEQLAEQQKTIQALQAALTEQQKKLDQMLAMAAPLTPVPAPAPPVRDATPPAPLVAKAEPVKAVPSAPRWFEKYTIRGYSQFRDNRIYASNPALTCESCDRSIGNNNNFFFRRGRMILSGDINDRVSLYFQTDFANAVNNGLNYGQVRDLYADIFLDKKKEFRIRAGQSKVPFGFENMQSSQNRLPFDRDDAINSGAPNERDIGAFLYWAPAKIRTRLATLSAAGVNGLKGTGDYGVIGLGIYNGQSSNRPEANNNLHFVARAAYPWQLKNGQYIEAGIQGYTGRYTVDTRTSGVGGPAGFAFADQRLAASLTVYPQPLGFQAEYNVGKGPQYNPATNTILTKTLRGGYAQTMFMKKANGQLFTPYYRFQYYSGGKKNELDARSYLVREHEVGLEWQQSNFLELTGAYSYGDRRYEDAARRNNQQKGSTVRLQVQINY